MAVAPQENKQFQQNSVAAADLMGRQWAMAAAWRTEGLGNFSASPVNDLAWMAKANWPQSLNPMDRPAP